MKIYIDYPAVNSNVLFISTRTDTNDCYKPDRQTYSGCFTVFKDTVGLLFSHYNIPIKRSLLKC